jgi:hypothetical protein
MINDTPLRLVLLLLLMFGVLLALCVGMGEPTS